MDKLTMTRKEGAKMFGVGLNQFDALMRRENDPLPFIRVGKRVLIPVDQFKEWIDRQVNRKAC